MKKFLFYYLSALFIVLLSANYASSVPAYPGLIEFSQPNGTTVNVFLKGDEYLNWATTQDGYTILFNEKGFYEYAILNEKGDLIPSGIVAKNHAERDAKAEDLLADLPKGLFFSKSQTGVLKQIKQIREAEMKNLKSFPTTGDRKLI